MGAGASSIASNDQRSATSGGASLLSRISVSSVAQTSKHAKRIQELESQVHELKARLCIETGSADPSRLRVPHASFQYPVEFNFSDESIDIRAPILPPLDLSCLSAEQAAVSEHLRKEYMEAEAGARDFMRILKKQNIRTMRDCWAQWHQLPLLANDPKMTSNSLPVSSPSPCSSAQSSGDFTLVKTLSDAAVSSLKRRDKVYMEEVFNRHAEPVGLCAKDLVSALHEIDKEIFSTNISEADAVIALKKVDSGKKGYATFNEFCIAAKVVCDKGESHEDEDCQDDEIVDDGDELELVAKLQKARDVFLRFAKVKGLTSEALIKALTDVHAPVLLSGQDCSPKQIFRRADANTSGSVDLIEFMRAAELPDDLEMVLEDLHLAVLAPALRAYLLQYPKAGNDQLNRFSNMRREDLFAAVDASLALLKHQLEVVHTTVKKATETKVQLQEAASKEPTKFSTFKASGGTIDNFFEGLEDRIGSPNLEFKKAMCCEHTTLKGSEFPFTSGNYKITTQPKKEWAYVVDGMKCPDMDHGREIKPIHELMKMPLSERAELEEAEVIAIVLYTGPMFVIYNAILRQYPENIYEDYGAADNFFPTTIFVLVSAVQKLSRCMDIPSGTLLFRGLGGSMELPDTFFVPSDKCRTPNALGYTEFGFMSTTADRKVAIQYSGVKEGKPKASIMEIHPNSVDRGADISDFSQYPQEKEFLIVPCSFVQGRGRQRTEITDGGGILSVIPVSVNINLTTETINQLRDKKKRLHIAAFKSLNNETMQWIVEEMDKDGRAIARAATEKTYLGDDLKHFHVDKEQFLDTTECELRGIMKEHDELGFDEYVDNLKYKALVTRMLNAQEWCKQKLQLWFENQEVEFSEIIFGRIKVCHRRWLSFLRQKQYATAEVRSKEERKDAAIKILQCKGLLATDDPSTEKVDDEPIVYAAVADGWAFEDLKFLIDAGANVLELNLESDSALHAALRHRDEQAARTLVEASADVTLISDGSTPLHLAASEGLASCITALLSKGACINDDVTGYDDDPTSTVCVTPMDFAAAAGHISCIQALMGAGAHVDCRNKNGKTPLYFAAKYGHAPCLVFLFENEADVKTCGEEALVAAAANGHVPCLVVLFENGADVKQRGDEALVAAAKNGHAPCLVALIKHGADVNQSGEEALVAAIDYSHRSCVDVLLQNGAAFKDGSSPIHYAAAEQKYDIVLFLLAQGAHVDARDKDGMTPMHYAAKTRNRDLINLLYEKGADVIAQDNDGKTPMHFAAASGSESCIEFLVTHGAIDSVHARDKDEKTPLHHAAAAASTRHLLNTDWQEIAQFKEDGSEYEYRDWDARPWSERSGWWKSCVEFLVANGADVNSRDKDGKTSMHYAATMWNESNRKENPKGKVSYIELLFANGADSNARDKNGKTPLHYAVAVAAKPVKDAKCFPYFFEDISRNIDFLCEKGADVNARDKDGKAPIHCAVLSGSESVIKFLCEKGADINTQDDAGKAPIHFAVSGSESFIKFLCEKGVDVNTQDDAGKAPLHYAIDARGAEATKVIMCLVDKGANVNSRDKNGSSPIHYAADARNHDHPLRLLYQPKTGWNSLFGMLREDTCRFVDYDLVGYLRLCGADINAQDNDGKTAMHLAVQGVTTEEHLHILRSLFDVTTGESQMHMKDNDGKTSIDYLIADWNVPCMTQIMYYCSNDNPNHYEHSKEYALILQRLINARDKDGKTLMHAAAASGDRNLCTRLQDNGSDVNAQDKDGKAPLHDAMEHVDRNNDHINVDLIRIGANFDARDNDGKTAIDYLVARGMQNLIDRFIDQGLGAILGGGWASPETQERFLCIIISDGKTLIDYLIADWNVPCMQKIMDYFSNRKESQHSEECALILERLINARDKDGKTLMHVAAASGDHRTCMFLQNNGSDVNAQDKDGKAPLHDAMELVDRRDIFSNVKLSTIEDLIRIGANFDARDNDGKTAIDYLVARGMQNLIDRFIDQSLGEILRKSWASPETQERFLCIIISDGKTLIDYLIADWNVPCMHKIMDYCSNRKESQHSEEYALILQRLINARGKDGKTLMHVVAAASGYDCDRMKTLFFLKWELGLDVNAQDKDGKAPLHDAMEAYLYTHYDPYAIVVLIAMEANFDARDNDGKTAIDYLVARDDRIGDFIRNCSTEILEKSWAAPETRERFLSIIKQIQPQNE